MIVGAACLSHTPYLDRARADPAVEQAFFAAIDRVAAQVAQWVPDLVVAFYPDHFNGFFYDLMPAFCIGVEATSVGDYGTVPGRLDVPADTAIDLARRCLASGIDAAVSYAMTIDHGLVQPFEMIAGDTQPPVIPIFMNCAAPPRPGFARVRALGQAVGDWARARPERILLLGSGGLSHDPPLPKLDDALPETRRRLIERGTSSHAARFARQSRVFATGRAFAAGTAAIRPLNPAWDEAMLDALVAGRLDAADCHSEEELTNLAGCGAHELRTWIAALTGLGSYRATHHFYAPVTEWITGTAVLTAAPTIAANPSQGD